MGRNHKALGVTMSSRALWLYRGWWLVIGLLLLSVTSIIVVLRLALGSEAFLKLGLLHPAVAAVVAYVIVLAMRLAGGPFANDRRKGVTSASSTAIAVRLWAMCFSLIVGAMLLWALVARLPNEFASRADAAPQVIEERSEIKAAAGVSTVSHSVKVTQ